MTIPHFKVVYLIYMMLLYVVKVVKGACNILYIDDGSVYSCCCIARLAVDYGGQCIMMEKDMAVHCLL